ncbi:hypothetical protein QBC34DRAFT_442107 [Podospora aff. communis PSN243]|uniref:Apple domain-containing protein n=1 Tax=Podospora aff. communis PSN243 TaxID=3040156 RepID=A0AAV9GC10_9PEZI|nr:hypothetical protein QBC34DRAFT_442107 [Podospora aff. communis PSN243]
MQFWQSLALLASTGVAVADDAVQVPNITNIGFDDGFAQLWRPVCGARGFRLFPVPLKTSDKFIHNTFSGCQKLCKLEAYCSSFSFQLKPGGLCRLYSRSLIPGYGGLVPRETSNTFHYEVNCLGPQIEGPKLVPYKGETPVPLPSGRKPAVTFEPFVPPTIKPVDSPPFVSDGPQSKPEDDDDFMSTYTYTEHPLTLSQKGTPPLTTGVPLPSGTELPVLPCLVNPGSHSPFSVVNEDFIPMVSRTNSIGPLLQPTAAPAREDPLLDPLNFEAPSFFLKEVSDRPGIFDLVYEDTGQFVAMTNHGDIVLTEKSTGPEMTNRRVTSIFNIDCRGAISIRYRDSNYIWSTKGASSSIKKGKSQTSSMRAIPITPPITYTEMRAMLFKDTTAVEALTEELFARAKRQERDIFLKARAPPADADLRAPQCKANPPGLESMTKAGSIPDTGNFCDDIDDSWGTSPYSFDGSCAVQSLCYDQCSGFSFKDCNAIFGTSMQISCLKQYKKWWEALQAVACVAQAAYFTGLAAIETGRRLYYKAQGNMCSCFCSNPSNTCLSRSGAFYCADIKGNDNDNCGGCGTKCGANSKCRSGICVCRQDQCGSTCLDLRNNPNNCGKCGVACNPKYCIDGRCYAPKPEQCAPDQSVFNNKFEVWSPQFANWTFAAYAPSNMPSDVRFSAANYQHPGGSTTALSVSMRNLPPSGRQAVVAQKNVKLCPGLTYELTFKLGHVNQVADSSVVSDAACDVRWLTGTPSRPFDNDAFFSSDKFSIGVSNRAYRTFGPWILTVKEGDPGVTRIKNSLYVDLSVVISCSAGSNARFVMTDIQMNSVGIGKTTEHALAAVDVVVSDGDAEAPELESVSPVFEELGSEVPEAVLPSWLLNAGAEGDGEAEGPELKPVAPVLEEAGFTEDEGMMPECGC